MAENRGDQNGEFSFGRSSSIGRRGLAKIQTDKKALSSSSEEVCHDDSGTPVRAQTLDELHSLQRKRSTPSTPIRGVPQAGGVFATISEEDRHKLQLQSIRFRYYFIPSMDFCKAKNAFLFFFSFFLS